MRSYFHALEIATTQHSNSFDPILDDYAFFEKHATESKNDLMAYARHVQGVRGKKGFINMLDLGSGSGSFTFNFLSQLKWPASRLALTLVEPGDKATKEAIEKLSKFSTHPIQNYRTLPEDLESKFDLILANHVFYFVSDMDQIINRLYQLCRPNGKILTAMSGPENFLMQCWAYGFNLIGERVPFYSNKDLENTLERMGLNYIREEVHFSITFLDSTANRMKILRFIFNQYLSSLPESPLLQIFDKHRKGKEINIRTHHFVYAF